MKVLVTGNKGYIGSVLCKELLRQGFEVVGFDTNFYNDCNFLNGDYDIKQINKDIREITHGDLEGINAIIHLAALSNDPMGELNPKLTSDINYRASVKLAKIAKKRGVERFIFSSSCSLYGVSGNDMIDENGKLNPITEYAKSKVESEKEISKLADKSFCPVFLRNATVYGISPMLRVDLVVNNLTGWAFTTGKIRIMSDGTPWRPLIHTQDICKAFIAVLRAPREIVHNQVFNVGKNEDNYQIKDIADIIIEMMPRCIVEYTGEHGVDNRTYRVDFSKIKRVLGKYFVPNWNLKKGVEDILTAYKEIDLTKEGFLGNKFTRLKRINYLLEKHYLDNEFHWIKR